MSAIYEHHFVCHVLVLFEDLLIILSVESLVCCVGGKTTKFLSIATRLNPRDVRVFSEEGIEIHVITAAVKARWSDIGKRIEDDNKLCDAQGIAGAAHQDDGIRTFINRFLCRPEHIAESAWGWHRLSKFRTMAPFASLRAITKRDVKGNLVWYLIQCDTY